MACFLLVNLIALQLVNVNTCYSTINAKNCIHAAGGSGYVAAEKTFMAVAGSGEALLIYRKADVTQLEGIFAENLAGNTWGDRNA